MDYEDPCKYTDCCHYDYCEYNSDLREKCRESYCNNPTLLQRIGDWLISILHEEKPCIDRFVDKNDGRRMKI